LTSVNNDSQPPSSYGSVLIIPDTPPASPTPQTSPPTTPTSQPHPYAIHQKLPSYVSCPDLFNRPQSGLRSASSEQNWEVESEEIVSEERRGSSGYESGRGSSSSQRDDSWRGSQKGNPVSPLRRLTIGASSDLAFWEEIRSQNEKEREKEAEVEKTPMIASPRGGSLVRSQRRNFAMAVLTEHAISKMGDGNISNGNKGLSQSQTVTEVIALHKQEVGKKEMEMMKKTQELTKKTEELEKKTEEMKKKNEELMKKEDEIDDLKRKLVDESTRARLFREKFQEMQKLYHEAESREQEKPQEAVDLAQLTAENEGLKKKVADERERRRFYRDKFQEMQKLYQESLDSIVEFQEKVKILHSSKNQLGFSGGLEPKKLETQLAEEKLRTKFFKDKFHEMNRLYQESLESVTTFVERSRTVEKMYRTTLDDAQHSKRKTQELEGLYIETQESVAFFKY
jgi:hypothetical protein